MEAFLIVLNVILILFTIVLAYVICTVLKASVNYYSQMLDWENKREPLLFRLPSQLITVIFVICFLALVL